jgi:hypothetical protein
MKKLLALTLLLASPLVWADIHINNAYARATPPGAPNGAVFMILKNTDKEPVALIKASVDVAQSAELHAHRMKDGMMQMRPVERIEIPGKGMAQLQPGGNHLMLMELKAPLISGEMIRLSLGFSDGSEQQLQLPVHKIGHQQQQGQTEQSSVQHHEEHRQEGHNEKHHL